VAGLAGPGRQRVLHLRVLIVNRDSARHPPIATWPTPTFKSTHVSSILAKLDASSRTEAATLAHRLGLLPPT
jgi:hypothetical protein